MILFSIPLSHIHYMPYASSSSSKWPKISSTIDFVSVPYTTPQILPPIIYYNSIHSNFNLFFLFSFLATLTYLINNAQLYYVEQEVCRHRHRLMTSVLEFARCGDEGEESARDSELSNISTIVLSTLGIKSHGFAFDFKPKVLTQANSSSLVLSTLVINSLGFAFGFIPIDLIPMEIVVLTYIPMSIP